MNNPQGPPSALFTPGFAHYSLAWSPFHTTRIALASSANFGLVGNGRLHIVSLAPGPGPGLLPIPTIDKHYETQDGLYDLAWSEIHENQLVTASGDGSIRLWDVMLNDLPIRAWQEHTREVFSVDWSNLQKDLFVSSSWDGALKIWKPDYPRSITTIQGHHACVYQALFSPHEPDLVATCSTDGTVKIFDLRTPAYVPSGPGTNNFTRPLSAAALTIPASGTEVLSLDWNKYRPFVIVSAGVDKAINVWDCRMVKTGAASVGGGPLVGGACEVQLHGHEYAVRKVQWSPHRADVLASASYDMTCRVWTTSPVATTQLLYIHDPHTEFVVGCAWSLYDQGILASCGWDKDILSVSLETLYGLTPVAHSSPGSLFTYTATPSLQTITIRTPETHHANWSLHASSIWTSSLYLANHLERLGLDKHPIPSHVLELGAGAGLPSILIAKTYNHVFVTASDYPDDQLIRTLSENVEQNGASRCRVVAYAWGSEPSALSMPGDEEKMRGFDVVFAADTLWNSELHPAFIKTLQTTLKKTAAARIHLVAGLHTGRYTLQTFLDALEPAGFELEQVIERTVSGNGERPWNVATSEIEDEQERRRWILWISLKWRRPPHIGLRDYESNHV